MPKLENDMKKMFRESLLSTTPPKIEMEWIIDYVDHPDLLTPIQIRLVEKSIKLYPKVKELYKGLIAYQKREIPNLPFLQKEQSSFVPTVAQNMARKSTPIKEYLTEIGNMIKSTITVASGGVQPVFSGARSSQKTTPPCDAIKDGIKLTLNVVKIADKPEYVNVKIDINVIENPEGLAQKLAKKKLAMYGSEGNSHEFEICQRGRARYVKTGPILEGAYKIEIYLGDKKIVFDQIDVGIQT